MAELIKICHQDTPCKNLSTCADAEKSPDLISFKITPIRDPESKQLTSQKPENHPEAGCHGNGEELKVDNSASNGEASKDEGEVKTAEDGKKAADDNKEEAGKEPCVDRESGDGKVEDDPTRNPDVAVSVPDVGSEVDRDGENGEPAAVNTLSSANDGVDSALVDSNLTNPPAEANSESAVLNSDSSNICVPSKLENGGCDESVEPGKVERDPGEGELSPDKKECQSEMNKNGASLKSNNTPCADLTAVPEESGEKMEKVHPTPVEEKVATSSEATSF